MINRPVDVDASARMEPLLVRGRQALRAYTMSRPHSNAHAMDMLVGTSASLDVVTHGDFLANAALVLRHVTRNAAPTHVLCESGALCTLIERRIGSW